MRLLFYAEWKADVWHQIAGRTIMASIDREAIIMSFLKKRKKRITGSISVD